MAPRFNRINHSPILEAAYAAMDGIPKLVERANTEAEGVLTHDLVIYTTAHFFGSRALRVLEPSDQTYLQKFLAEALPRVVLADLIRRRNREKGVSHYSFAHEAAHAALALREPNATGLPRYLYIRTNESVITPYFDDESLLEEITAMPWSVSEQEPGKEGKKRPVLETIFDRRVSLPTEPMLTLQKVTKHPVIHELCEEQLKYARDLMDRAKRLDLKDSSQVLATYCEVFRNLLLSAFWSDLHGTIQHVNFTADHAEDIKVIYKQVGKYAKALIEKLQTEDGEVPALVKSYGAGIENPKIGFELFKELVGESQFPSMKSVLTPGMSI